MKKEYIEAFIKYGINKELTTKKVVSMVLGMSIFYIIGIFYGFMLGGVEHIFGIAIIIVSFLSTVIIFAKANKLSLKNYFIIAGAISLEATINFLLITLILSQMLETDIWINVVIVFTPILTVILYFIITKCSIKKGRFLNAKEVKKNKIPIYSLWGGVTGIWIARTFLKDVGQTTALTIVVIGSLFLSSIFSLGTINFLKLFYIKKL